MSTSLRTGRFGSPPPPRLFSITAILLISTYFLLHPDVQLSKPLTPTISGTFPLTSTLFSPLQGGIFGLKSAPHVHYLGEIESNHEI